MGLQRVTFRGIVWTGGGNVVASLLNLVIVAVLAHVLSPGDFGLMGMVLTVINFGSMVADIGLGSAIIQDQNTTKSQISTFFYLNLLQGLALSILTYLCASPIAQFFQHPELKALMQTGAFVFAVMGFGLTFRTLLQKEMRFKHLAIIDNIGTVSYGMISIILALKGFGILSLLIGFLLRQAIEGAVLWVVAGFRPLLVFRIGEIKHMLKFGSYILGERTVNYFSRNLDNILIGKYLGPESLGYYTLAYQLMFVPISKVSQVVGKVTYPAFAKIQHDNEKMRKGFLSILQYISLLIFPLMAVVCLLAQEFILSVYGAIWYPAVLVLQIFCLRGIVESIGTTVGGFLYAKGRADISFRFNIFYLAVVAAAIFTGLPHGIVGVALSMTAASLPVAYIWHRRTNALIDLSWKPFLKSMQFPTTMILVLVPVILGAKVLLRQVLTVKSDVAVIVCMAILAAAICVPMVFFFKRSLISEVWQMFVRAEG